MTTAEFNALLIEGKRYGKGRADEVALSILENGEDTLRDLWPLLYHSDFGIRSRAGHVVEAVAKKQPKWFVPYQSEILTSIACPQLDPAFNLYVPSLLGLLRWPDETVAEVVNRLMHWLSSLDHQFVKVFCLQSLTDLAVQQPWLKHEVEELVHQQMTKGGKAINARGRMLLKTLAKIPEEKQTSAY